MQLEFVVDVVIVVVSCRGAKVFMKVDKYYKRIYAQKYLFKTYCTYIIIKFDLLYKNTKEIENPSTLVYIDIYLYDYRLLNNKFNILIKRYIIFLPIYVSFYPFRIIYVPNSNKY